MASEIKDLREKLIAMEEFQALVKDHVGFSRKKVKGKGLLFDILQGEDNARNHRGSDVDDKEESQILMDNYPRD